jgi:hypothetical protein
LDAERDGCRGRSIQNWLIAVNRSAAQRGMLVPARALAFRLARRYFRLNPKSGLIVVRAP